MVVVGEAQQVGCALGEGLGLTLTLALALTITPTLDRAPNLNLTLSLTPEIKISACIPTLTLPLTRSCA